MASSPSEARANARHVVSSHGLGLASYMPAAVTTGMREIRLLQAKGLTDRAELRQLHPIDYRTKVFEANLRDAEVRAARLRGRLSNRLVINPGSFDQEGWSQEQYIDYWLSTIEGHCADLRLHPDGLMSRGVRVEVSFALMARIPIFDDEGRKLSAFDLERHDAIMRLLVCRKTRWRVDDVDAYAPPVDFVALQYKPYEPARIAREQFAAFITKHNGEIKGISPESGL